MRYGMVAIPFMDRYHITLTAWSYDGGKKRETVLHWDLGPEHIHHMEIREILSFLAADLAE